MKILLIEPERQPVPMEIDGSLASMQQLVGGTIQAVYPWEDPVALVCNDEGKLLGLPLNRAIEDYGVIAGTFFICGLSRDNFADLSEPLMEKYRNLFRYPEKFIHTPDGLLRLRFHRGEEPDHAKRKPIHENER